MPRFRPLLALAAFVTLAGPAAAQPPAAFEDAAVHAIQFIDKSEGWAVGDDGVVWHSVDGGTTWERQKTGTRASLRSVHFQTPYTGWAVGRVDLPGGTSVGVMLRTTDGGLNWEENGTNVLPGLHAVRFFDERNGFVCGDGSDAFPAGMFTTADGGRTWRPLSGPRVPSWRAADFTSPTAGVVAGAWSKLGTVRGRAFADADLDPLAGRTIHGVKVSGTTAFAVGDGGAVLASTDGGVKWGSVNLGLSPAVLASCDFKCVAAYGADVWVAGRPGGVVLHSGDLGKTWEVQKTNLQCPVNGMNFLDTQTGWVVGELGTIAGTTDGGKTWKVQRLGGQRGGVLFLQSAGKSVPLDAVTALGHGDGYLCAAVGVMAADPATASPVRANDSARLRQAMRQAGGLTGETVWAFPVAAHADGLAPRDLMASWDRAHGGKANDQLLRQAVLAIRVWQPEVIVTDVVATDATAAEVLVLHAAKEAFKQAADPNAFPEQIADLGLKPWAAKKLYALSPEDPQAPVKLDLTVFHPLLGDSAKDYAEPAARLVSDAPFTGRRCFKLVAHRLTGAEQHAGLMDGIILAPAGPARRPEHKAVATAAATERQKAAQSRRQLEGLASVPDKELAGGDKVLASLGAELPRMPDDIAARTCYAVGMQFVRAGRWAEAREVFGLLTMKYPGDPTAIEAFRWLTRYHASSEARRRVEVQQTLTYGFHAFEATPGAGRTVVPAHGTSNSTQAPVTTADNYRMHSPAMVKAWHQGALDLEPKLTALGPVYSRDPAAWLCFLAARRQTGRHVEADKFVADYFTHTPGAAQMAPGADPLRDCLAAELWLTNRAAFPAAPKPVGVCRHTETRPFLDGKLDDACWKDPKPLTLDTVAAEDRAFVDDYLTQAFFAYDDKFLYVAVKCWHPAGEQVPPAAKRGRDADLRGHDRVDILLDLDRDYQTYYRFQVDHRGCLAEDCWGDKTWNPKYYVAFVPDESGWTVEYAIPLDELTGDRPSHGKAWAVNVTRVVPGKGVRTWSGPASADPRPEGMGLLQFRAEK
jgi:photosystem II stability/assembly factor-like uncharacterized protein